MKNILTLSSLGFFFFAVATELVRASGIQLPGILGIGNAFLAFFLVLFAQVLVADYGSKPRPIALPQLRALTRPVRRTSIASAHHHVYAVRRGVEAARLANPNRIVVFPRRAPVSPANAR